MKRALFENYSHFARAWALPGYMIATTALIVTAHLFPATKAAAQWLQGALLVAMIGGISLVERNNIQLRGGDASRALGIASVAAGMIAVSLFINDAAAVEYARGALQAGYIFFIVLILPQVISAEDKTRVVNVFIACACVVLALNLFYHLSGRSYNTALAHPFAAHLWFLLAFFLCWRGKKPQGAEIMFALALIWTGARLSWFLALVGSIVVLARRFNREEITRALVSAGVVIVLGATAHILMPKYSPLVTIQRSMYILPSIPSLSPLSSASTASNDQAQAPNAAQPQAAAKKNEPNNKKKTRPVYIENNRSIVYREALLAMTDAKTFLFGTSGEMTLPVKSPIDNKIKWIAAHNGFLRLAMFYGVPFALLIYTVWFSRFRPPHDDTGRQAEVSALFYWFIPVQSLLFSTFWTNMADPPVLLAVCLLMQPFGREKPAAHKCANSGQSQ